MGVLTLGDLLEPMHVLLIIVAAIVAWFVMRMVARKRKAGGKQDSTRQVPEGGVAGLNPTPVAGIEEAPTTTQPAVLPPVRGPEKPPPDTAAKGGSIFISYRRQDSQHITGRVYDRLILQFGKESVFKDVDSIPLGRDFRDHLREQVGRCAVLVAVIGKNWNPLSNSGTPRLSDARDHLRIEIESALERQIPVIPVLVDGIEMPSEEELPPSLGKLAFYNGISIRPDPDFHHDADRLVRGIEQLLK